MRSKFLVEGARLQSLGLGIHYTFREAQYFAKTYSRAENGRSKYGERGGKRSCKNI